jgi:biotin carboxylase
VKRTLLVDTNRAAVPIYRALCELGHEVWVVGGKSSEPLAKLALKYVQLDYSNVARLATFVKEKAFDYLVPGCTDVSYHVCAEINGGRFLGIDTPADTYTINTKHTFRERAIDLGLPVPRVLSKEQATETESVIVKPADAFSGRGMTVLRGPTPALLSRAIDKARKVSKSGIALIEEFVTGQLFSHSAFLWNGTVTTDFIVQEDCTTSPFTVDTSRVSEHFPKSILESLREGARRLVSGLHLVNGLVHTQFIVQGDRYWIIEVTRRCPGDLYSLLIEYATGYPYAASYAATFVGGQPVQWGAGGIQERITRHTVTSKTGASLWGFRFNEPVDIRLFVPLATFGDSIGASPYGRAGIFFFRSSSEYRQKKLYERLLDRSLYSFT